MRTAAIKSVSARCAPTEPAVVLNPITLLTLPAPPSTNALYKNLPGRGRGKTKAYKDWSAVAGRDLKAQLPGRVTGRVVIIICIERSSASSDIDNRLKALFDLLVAHGVIDDDRFVTAFAIAWAAKANGLVRVAIMPAVTMTLQLQIAPDGASGGFFISAPEQEGPANDGY